MANSPLAVLYLLILQAVACAHMLNLKFHTKGALESAPLQSSAYFGMRHICFTCLPLAEGLTGTILKEREKLGAASIADSGWLAGLSDAMHSSSCPGASRPGRIKLSDWC